MDSRSSFGTGVDDETGVARRLWAKYKKHAAFSQYDSFVVALAARTLKRLSFLNYIQQDAYFLKKYAEVCKMAEDSADNDDDKKSFNRIWKAVEEELNLHNASIGKLQKDLEEEVNLQSSLPEGHVCFNLGPYTAARDSPFENAWDDESAKEYSPNMATVEYTEFLLAIAAGKVEGGLELSGSVNPIEKNKITAYTIGAMTPCSRLYAFLGQEIVKALEHDISVHPYKQWIETYSSEDYEASVLQTEKLLDKLANSLTGEEHEVLGRLYHHALKLEKEFFSAQPLYQKTLVPLLKQSDSASCRYSIVSDFKLSCTVLDSSAALSELAISTTLKSESNDCKSSSDLRNTWDTISTQYPEGYEEFLGKILPPEQVVTFDYEGLYKSLEHLSQFEMEANSKVVELGVLQDLNIDDIEDAREHVAFQDGCVDFFEQILRKLDGSNVDMHVLSVSWSGDIIRAAFLSRGLDGLHIHSNKLTFVESMSTGSIDKCVETPVGKLKIFRNIWTSAKDNEMEHISIYIGDNLGDLLCLLEADIGIVFGASSTLRRIGKHFGVSFVPLFSGLLKQEREYTKSSSCWTRQSGILYTVSSWSEIHAFLLGSSN